jgi:D-proline reductase (dithiol) PrdB
MQPEGAGDAIARCRRAARGLRHHIEGIGEEELGLHPSHSRTESSGTERASTRNGTSRVGCYIAGASEEGRVLSDAQFEVDPWRFAGGFLQRVLSGAIPDEPAWQTIPWAPLRVPLARARVALVSTAGLSMKGDQPFDMDFERAHPTRGDSSFRRLRADATADSIEANHLHIDTSYIRRDLNVALPLDRLRELVAEGVVGAMAETHYSIMGYQGSDTGPLERETAPAIAAAMKSEEVDLAILAPV